MQDSGGLVNSSVVIPMENWQNLPLRYLKSDYHFSLKAVFKPGNFDECLTNMIPKKDNEIISKQSEKKKEKNDENLLLFGNLWIQFLQFGERKKSYFVSIRIRPIHNIRFRQNFDL